MNKLLASYMTKHQTGYLLFIFLGLTISFHALNSPLTFDDAFNANVALSVAKGAGYATHIQDVDLHFNHYISTGFFYIAPFSIFLKYFTSSHFLITTYSTLVSLIFFLLVLKFANKYQSLIPKLLIFGSICFLFHGKTDVVPGTPTESLPSPSYGYWFQFLGNMSGLWALIAGILLLIQTKTNEKYGNLILLFLLFVFSCNAKLMHAIPGIAAVTFIFLISPRDKWKASLLSVTGILLGSSSDRLIAKFSLHENAFNGYKSATEGFVKSNLSEYTQMLDNPSINQLMQMTRNIPQRLPIAADFVGWHLLIASVIAIAAIFKTTNFKHGLKNNNVEILLTVCFLVTACYMLWWSTMASAPTRFLTPVAPLCLVGLASSISKISAKLGKINYISLFSIGILSMTSFIGVWQHSSASIPILREVRENQEEVSDISANLINEKTIKICGNNWFYSHEIMFLSSSIHGTECHPAKDRLAVIPKHIFPENSIIGISSKTCKEIHSSLFYKLAFCTGEKF